MASLRDRAQSRADSTAPQGSRPRLQTGQDFINYLPEKSKGGEIGVKFDALDRRLRASITGFYNDLTNVQLTSAISQPQWHRGADVGRDQFGQRHDQGAGGRIDRRTRRQSGVQLGLSYVSAKFTSGCDSDQFIFNSGGLRPNFDTRNPTAAALPLCDITGTRLPLGSPWIVIGGVSWDKDIGSAGTSSSSIPTSRSKMRNSSRLHNLADTGVTFLLNARFGVRHDNFSVALFAAPDQRRRDPAGDALV